MKNMIPQTLDDLNQAKQECLNPALLNDGHKQYSFGKFVWHYSFKDDADHDDFILVTRHTNKQMQKSYIGKKPDDMSIEDYAQEDLNNKTKNEFLGYKVMRAMHVNVPDHHLIYDVHQNNYQLALEMIKGLEPSEYFANPAHQNKTNYDAVLKPSYQFFAPMIASARWDLKNENMLIADNQIHHIDFDMILEESKYWDHDFKENQNKAVTLLKDYIDPMTKKPRENLGAHYHYLTQENILQSFKDAKENLTAAKDQFTHSNEKMVLHHMHGRIDACVNYLKPKI